MPNQPIPGIHHITAITADAQKNIDFYCGVLGLRLVKLTVNFDDPGSYHLYYGDELGRPGTILTFFAWPGAYRGRIGPPQVTVTAFSVPIAAMDFWARRLKQFGIESQPATERFGQPVLSFLDPDAMKLEIIGSDAPGGIAWPAGPVAAENAIRGFHGATISETGYEKTAKLLTETMGFQLVGSDQNRFRYRAAPQRAAHEVSGAPQRPAAGSRRRAEILPAASRPLPAANIGGILDVVCVPGAPHGEMGAGVVHHIAFRAKDDAEQLAWQKQIGAIGLDVSPVMERCYFRSIYYREPGGVLFEIATEGPGFIADEPAEKLGTRLMLPPWLEAHRAEIEKAVPPVRLPGLEKKR